MATVNNVTTIAAMAALTPSVNTTVFLNQDGREGLFECVAGTAPSDPLQGLYVSSSTSGFYWARVWDGTHGRPEWWGAVLGNESFATANLSALNACIAACRVSILSSGTYFVSGTLKVQTNYRHILAPNGASCNVTSIDPTKDVIQIGADLPNSPQYTGITFEHVVAGWKTHPTAPTTGTMAARESAPKAWRIQYTLTTKLNWCFAIDALIGFYYYGNINCHFHDCYSVRNNAFLGSNSNEFHVGHWLKGDPHYSVPESSPGAHDGFSYAGGNASMFFERCSAPCKDEWMDFAFNCGFYCKGDYADLYFTRPETSKCHIAMIFDGSGGTYSGGNGNVSVIEPSFDNCYENAIYITNDVPLGKFTLLGGFLQGPDNPSSDTGKHRIVRIESGYGKVYFDGCRITGNAGNNSVTKLGVFVYQHNNVTFGSGVQIDNVAFPATFDGATTGCDGCAFLGTIDGHLNNSGGGRSALALVHCTNSLFSPRILAPADGFQNGVLFIGTANDNCSVDTTRVSAEGISSGYRLRINATNIGMPGSYTGAGGPGTAGQGILVSGITKIG